MSYVLHAWEAPAAENVQQATAQVLGPGRSSCVPSARLASFAAALRETYPDSHGLEAQGLDSEASVWSDSPLQPAAEAAVFAFGLTRTDADFVRFIAHAAADHGLHLLDMQAAVLYRPDRRVVFRDGSAVALSRPDPEVTPPQRRPDRILDPRGANPDIIETVLRRLSPLGFRAVDRGSAGFCGLVRTQGVIRQGVFFSPLTVENDGLLRLYVHFGFGCDAIRAFLDEAAPVWRQYVPPDDGQPSIDITLSVRDIFTAAEHALGPSAPVELASHQIEGWIVRFCDWFEEFAVARLDRVRDVAALNELLHNPARAEIATQGMPWRPHMLFATLAIVQLSRGSAMNADVWLDHVRAQISRTPLGQALRADAAQQELGEGMRKYLEAALAMNRLAERIRGVGATT